MGVFDRRGPFRRRKDGTYSVDLGDTDRRLLGELLVQLRSLLSSDSPALVRLFPPAYGDDEERNQGYAALAGAELVERRLDALSDVEATLHAEELTEEQLSTWMRSINDLRLVLGTVLDVDEDSIPPSDLDDDTAPMYATYEYLGYLLDRVVAALAS
jgi:hypothetical protein